MYRTIQCTSGSYWSNFYCNFLLTFISHQTMTLIFHQRLIKEKIYTEIHVYADIMSAVNRCFPVFQGRNSLEFGHFPWQLCQLFWKMVWKMCETNDNGLTQLEVLGSAVLHVRKWRQGSSGSCFFNKNYNMCICILSLHIMNCFICSCLQWSSEYC